MEKQTKHRLKNINREEVVIVLEEIIHGTSEMEASVLNIPHNRVSSHFQNSSLQETLCEFLILMARYRDNPPARLALSATRFIIIFIPVPDRFLGQ